MSSTTVACTPAACARAGHYLASDAFAEAPSVMPGSISLPVARVVLRNRGWTVIDGETVIAGRPIPFEQYRSPGGTIASADEALRLALTAEAIDTDADAVLA